MSSTGKGSRPTKIILSLPRCGTHFMWSRFIASGQFQLIYDADRLPALMVLSKYCNENLDFLYPAASNPNFNFQYNSLHEVDKPLTAAEHVARLAKRYSAPEGYELFQAIMSRQDVGSKTLFSIKRFCYTMNYDNLFKKGVYPVDHALEALDLLYDWMHQWESNPTFVMVIRNVPEWIESLSMLWGRDNWALLAQLLKDLSKVLYQCQTKSIPVFWMKDVIRAMNSGILDFEEQLHPLVPQDFEEIVQSEQEYLEMIHSGVPKQKAILRLDRLLAYLKEKDPVLRTSLVQSLGSFLLGYYKFIPFLRRRIRTDIDGQVLNNAKIKTVL